MSFKYIVRFYAICYTRSERSCLHNNPNSRKTLITLCHIVRFYAICYTRSERSCLHNSPMYSMASASLFRTLCRLFFVRSWDQHIVLWLLFFQIYEDLQFWNSVVVFGLVDDKICWSDNVYSVLFLAYSQGKRQNILSVAG